MLIRKKFSYSINYKKSIDRSKIERNKKNYYCLFLQNITNKQIEINP